MMGSMSLPAAHERHSELLRLKTSHAITRWSSPQNHEPAHGLFVRIAEQLHYNNAEHLSRKCGFDGGFPDPGQILLGLEALPLRQFDELERWTPVVTPTVVTIAGQSFRRTDWSVGVRRYCPSCFVESGHHRAWWDLKIMSRCPLHDQLLEQKSPNGATLYWRNTDFVRLARALERGGQDPSHRILPDIFESYVLGRLGAMPRRKIPDLDYLPLADVTDLVRWTGKLEIGGWRQDTPAFNSPEFRETDVIAAGYRVAKGGEESIVRLLCKIGRNCPERIPSLQHSFGWFYPCVMAVNSRPGATWMLQLIREAADRLGISGLRYRYQVENRHTFAVRDIVGITRLPRGAVLNLAEIAGIEPRGTASKEMNRFDRRQLEKMLSTLCNSFCREDAARRVGLDQMSFDRLARKGIFGDPIRRCSKDVRQDRFPMAALDRFVQEIIDRCHPMPADGVPSTKLVDLIKLTALPAEEVLDQIIHYRIPLRTRWPRNRRRSSIAEVRVLIEDLPSQLKVARRIKTGKRVRPSAKSVEVVCRSRAAGMLGLPIAAVDQLIDLGVLHRAKRPGGKEWRGNITAASLAKVAGNTLSISDLGRLLGRPAKSLLEEACETRLFDDPLCKFNSETLVRFKLVSWWRAIDAFAKDEHRFRRAAFWRNLDWYLHNNQSTFMRKRLVSSDQAHFWTTSRDTPVSVSHGLQNFLDFSTHISARTAAHAFLERELSAATLYRNWPGLEIKRDDHSDGFVLTFGISLDSFCAATHDPYTVIRAVLDSFHVVSKSTLEQEQMLMLPLSILKLP